MKSDLEIAQSATLKHIRDIAEIAGIAESELELYGRHKAKIDLSIMKRLTGRPDGKYIVVTAITPTPLGEGKTVTNISLALGLARLGKKVINTLRQPSMGPVFGVKGGATGGGHAQVVPMEDINLHFTGDIHAVAAAHNLLASLLDNHLHHDNVLNFDPKEIYWNRTLDMNDRTLRQIVVGLGGTPNGITRESGFDITAASEVMAILALSTSLQDMRRRLGRIVIGNTVDGNPITAEELKAAGAMAVIMREAIKPNLMQTAEGSPVLVHTGPFGNIAHGTSSVISHNMGIRLADYVVNEAGFAADLGAEKYFDIVMRSSGIAPSCTVLVTTVQSLRNQGEGDLERGLPNLERHIQNMQRFGAPIVVAINRFPNDTSADLAKLADYCAATGAVTALSEAFTKGGAGAVALAEKVVETIDKNPNPNVQPIYSLEESLEDKIGKVACDIYGAAGARFTEKAKTKLQQYKDWGFAKLPVCIAKTQYSFSDNPKLLGAPSGWVLNVTDASLSAGAGFVVVIAGNMMLMPGLPKVSRAASVDVNAKGEIVGI